MKKIFYFIISFIAISPSLAQTNSDVDVLSMGLQSTSCAEYINSSANDKLKDAIWTQGFISGYNYTTTYKKSKQLDIPQTDTVILFTKSFCQKNPLWNTIAASWVLVENLGGNPVNFKYNK